MKKFILALLISFFVAGQVQAASGPCADFFYGVTCPHCQAVKPFITQLSEDNPTWQINWYEVYNDQDNSNLLQEMFTKHRVSRGGVPVVFVGDEYIMGDEPIKRSLEQAMQEQSVYSCPTDRITDKIAPIPQLEPLQPEEDMSNKAEDLFGSLDTDIDKQSAAAEQYPEKPSSGIVAYAIFGFLLIVATVFIIRNRS